MSKSNHKKVPVHLVYDAIESADDVYDQYLDTEEMEVINLPDPDSDFAEYDDGDEELMERIEDDDRYIALPSQYDIHEYRIMEEYISELKDDKLAHKLERAIRGRGAFRRFKDTLIEAGRIQSWFEYQNQYYWQLARKWCMEHDLEFIDDQKENQRT